MKLDDKINYVEIRMQSVEINNRIIGANRS
jgi:hypothetical protein